LKQQAVISPRIVRKRVKVPGLPLRELATNGKADY
jgi:hypothetical protein